jgi:outer membrane receptor protein involved in Fe transport
MFQRFIEAGPCNSRARSRLKPSLGSTLQGLGVIFVVALSMLFLGVQGAFAEPAAEGDSQTVDSLEMPTIEDDASEAVEADEVVSVDEADEGDQAIVAEGVDEEVAADDPVVVVVEDAADLEEQVETPTAENQDPIPAVPKTKGIEVIFVEAQRRSEDRQKVPESISSFSGLDLAEQGLENFNDLQYSVPNLFSGGGLATQITLRGVGSEIVGPGIDPGFAVHVNNVFSARESTGRLDFYDIERIDVLRGLGDHPKAAIHDHLKSGH